MTEHPFREDADFPPVVPGTRVVIQLKQPTYYDSATGAVAGRVSAEPAVMVIHDRDACWPDDWAEDYESQEEAAHGRTICAECIPQWALDYYVELADDQEVS